jgi:hypothetical protein
MLTRPSCQGLAGADPSGGAGVVDVQVGSTDPGVQVCTGGSDGVGVGVLVVGVGVGELLGLGLGVGVDVVGAAEVDDAGAEDVGWVGLCAGVPMSCLFGNGAASFPDSHESMKIFQARPGRSRPYSGPPYAS